MSLSGCKFEVGKTYKCTSGIVAKCLFAYEGRYYYNMIGEVIEGIPGYFLGDKHQFSGNSWSEHKKPRSVTFYVNIYENNGELKTGVVWSTKEKALVAATGDAIDTMEVTWTERVE